MVAIRVGQSVRRGLQRVDVVVLLAVKRDAGNGTVEQFLLQHVGIFALGLEVEHLLGEHTHSHGSTGLTVHRVVRQIVVVGERLAHVGGTDCTGDIHTTGDDVLPETLGGVDQPLIAEQPTYMGHAGAQVADAHGVAVRGLLVAHGFGSLEVGGLVEAEVREDVVAVQRLELLGVELRILAAHVDEVPGKRQVTLLAGLLIQLGEGELNLRVAVGTVNLAFFGAEVGVQTVGHLLGDLKGLLIAGHLMVGDGGLDVVTHHIHLVALLNQAEAREVGPYAGLDLIRSVQVAVRLLSAGDEIDRAIAQRLEFGIRMVDQRISGFLKPLVDVGILEHHAVEFVVQFAGDNLQIGDRVAFVVSQLVAGRVVRHCGVDFVVHHSPLVGDDGFDDLVATPRWNVSMSRNCGPSRSTVYSSCSAKPTPGPRLAMTGACHWSTSTAPPPIPKIVRSPVTMWTPVAWPSTISFLAVAGTSPLSAAAKPIPLPPTAPRVRSRHWLSWASNRPDQSGMASGMRVGAAPPPACCSIRASRLTLWSAKTTSWPEAALTCSSSRIYAFRMTSPLSADDNWSVLTSSSGPALTSIDNETETIGRRAA